MNNNQLPPPDEPFVNTADVSSRLQWIDAMRGFSMLMVVFGHVLVWSDVYSQDSVLVRLLMTFRMPLFFFVSGFFSYRLITWWNWSSVGDIVKRKIQAQIIGTIIFFCIYHYAMGSTISFSNGFGAYWFTIVLFQMYITYLLLSLISKKLGVEIVIPIMISLSVVLCGILFVNKLDYPVARVLSWLQLAEYLQFFTLGLVCHKYRSMFMRVLSSNAWYTVFIAGWIIGALVIYSEWIDEHLGLVASINRNLFVRYCGLICVVTLFSRCALQLSSSSNWAMLLRFIGRRTLDIYFIHFFFLPHVDGISDWLTHGDRIIFQILYATIITCGVMAMCLLISGMLRQSPLLASWLFGVAKKESKVLANAD